MNKFLIKNPIISEKSTAMSAENKYVFLVDDAATVSEVGKAVEKLYKVDVIKTNVINTSPKPRRIGRNLTMKPGYKKVILTLKRGQKLDILPS